jgi:hypothetical protein
MSRAAVERCRRRVIIHCTKCSGTIRLRNDQSGRINRQRIRSGRCTLFGMVVPLAAGRDSHVP